MQSSGFPLKTIAIGAAILFLFVFLKNMVVTIPAGHVGVVGLFGKVHEEVLYEGLHFINPMKKVVEIDCRNKQFSQDGVDIPSRDQLNTEVDFTVKWRVDATRAANAFQNTGDSAQLEMIHLVPKLRSLVRESGKAVARAEDFFYSQIQTQMQSFICTGLRESLAPKGLIIEEVLIRSIQLPSTIQAGVNAKKVREQEVERQRAELERYTTEQQQQVVMAEAQLKAARAEAEKRKAFADALSYEITTKANAEASAIRVQGEAIKAVPLFIQLKTIQQWDGKLPTYNSSGSIPLIQLPTPAAFPAPVPIGQ